MRRAMILVIEYESKKPSLCPLCVKQAIEEYSKNVRNEYEIKNLVVREAKMTGGK